MIRLRLTLFLSCNHLIWLISKDQWSRSYGVIESLSSGTSFWNFATTVVFSFMRMVLLDFNHFSQIIKSDCWKFALWILNVDSTKVRSHFTSKIIFLFLQIRHRFIDVGLLVSIVQLILAETRIRLRWIRFHVCVADVTIIGFRIWNDCALTSLESFGLNCALLAWILTHTLTINLKILQGVYYRHKLDGSLGFVGILKYLLDH